MENTNQSAPQNQNNEYTSAANGAPARNENESGMGNQNYTQNNFNGQNNNGPHPGAQNNYGQAGFNGQYGNAQNAFNGQNNGGSGMGGRQTTFGGPNGPFADGYGPQNGPGGSFCGWQNGNGPSYPNGQPPKKHSELWKKIGTHALYGVITGVIASVILLGAACVTVPKMISFSVKQAVQSYSSEESGTDPDDWLRKLEEIIGGQNEQNNQDGQNNQNSLPSTDTPAEQTAFLGVSGKSSSDLSDDEKNGITYPDGVYVTNVVDGSGASLGGIKEGDVITAVDDQPVSSFEDLSSIISSHSIGDQVTITLSRLRGNDFNQSTHSVTLSERPNETTQQ